MQRESRVFELLLAVSLAGVYFLCFCGPFDRLRSVSWQFRVGPASAFAQVGPGIQVDFATGLNLFSVPATIPAAADTCFELLSFLGGESQVEHISRLNPTGPSLEACRFTAGSPSGTDFPITEGEGYQVQMHVDATVSFLGAPACPAVDLVSGLNLVGIPSPPVGLGCFDLLEILGPEAVTSIQRFDLITGAFETCTFFQNGRIEPTGEDFPIVAGEAYLISMRQAVPSFNPNDPALCAVDVDTDGDGLTDAEEVALGTDPNNPDTDGEGLADGAEVNLHNTDPTRVDTDNDQFTDAAEVAAGSDPRDPFDTPIGDLPPDPSVVAPPLDMTVVSTVYNSVRFLFEGRSPIQTGVNPATIEPRRTSVIRGRVLDGNASPLPQVEVTVHGFPQFGATRTRLDGVFDMVVNGGGWLTLHFEGNGRIPVQRQVHVPWQEFAVVGDVVMLSPDTASSVIDFTDPIQVHRATPSEDADGRRQATVFFRQGTTATMALPDGTTQVLDHITVRATEFTVGDRGPNAMPAELPPASMYTYALAFTVDEAQAAGAMSVRFDPAAISYTENFVGFPVGTVMPAGAYDSDMTAWLPKPNGRVIEILDETGGLARLAVDAAGVEASSERLAALDITDSERRTLAQLYDPGQQLWRVPIAHFSSWDINQGFAPAPGADAPAGDVDHPPDCVDPNNRCGSIIEAQNQVVGQQLAVVGTPFTLNYRSSRVPGFSDPYRLDIKMSEEAPQVQPLAFEIIVNIHGRILGDEQHSPFGGIRLPVPQPGQVIPIFWDGLDPYGRRLQGPRAASVCLRYIYPAVYVTPANVDALFEAFGYNGNGISIGGIRSDATIPIEKCLKPSDAGGGSGNPVFPGFSSSDFYRVGGFNAQDSAAHLGGWTLDVHHTLAPETGFLYKGSGAFRDQAQGTRIIDTFAGGGGTQVDIACDPNDPSAGIPAREAGVGAVLSLAFGPDGSLYATSGSRVLRISPEGRVCNFAGQRQQSGFAGDSGPATAALFSLTLWGVDVGPDGSVYIADSGNGRVRRVDSNGIVMTVAGNGDNDFDGNEGPALSAGLSGLRDVAVAPDGTLYILQTGAMLRRMTPDGIIRTITRRLVCPQGFREVLPISATCLRRPNAITLGPEGSIFVAEGRSGVPPVVRKIDPAGIISPFAGLGAPADGVGDGLPATEAALGFPHGVAVSPDGAVYIASGGLNHLNRIRVVGDDGLIHTVAGTGDGGFSGDKGPALMAKINISNFGDIVYGPDHAIYIAEADNNRIRRVANSLPGFTAATDIGVASKDGRELFIFDATGRHLRTLNTLTGSVIWSFGYDSEGHLVTVTDAYDAVTTIERAADGTATRIVSPDGLVTTLEMDDHGYLVGITNPAGERHAFAYNALGLMQSRTTPERHVTSYSYDPIRGRLAQVTDPEGGFKTYTRNALENGFEVTETTKLGRVTTFQVITRPNGDERFVSLLPDGTSVEYEQRRDGSEFIRKSDGTEVLITTGPDPRFGMQAPIQAQVVLTTPSRLTHVGTTQREAVLADANDLLSLQTLTETVTINGRAYVEQYDAATNTIMSRTPEGRERAIRFSANGQPIRAQVGDLVPVQIGYDSRGRPVNVTQSDGMTMQTMGIAYDTNGFVESVTDALGRATRYEHDLAGRVTKQVLPDLRELLFSYDRNGNLQSLTPPSRPAHRFTYDATDRVTTYAPPVLPDVPLPTAYTYNDDHQVEGTTRPNGQEIDLVYDTDTGRLNEIVIPRGTYGYVYDTAGRTELVTDPGGGSVSLAYDGNLIVSETLSGEVSGSVSMTYNNDLRVDSRSVNGAWLVNRSYDGNGELVGAGEEMLSLDPATGLLTQSAIGNLTMSMTHSNFGEEVQATVDFQGVTVHKFTWVHDGLGRVVARGETVSGTTSTKCYEYDTVGRLTRVFNGLDGSGCSGVLVEAYRYDASSNRVYAMNSGGVVDEAQVVLDEQNRLLEYGSWRFGYTPNGELDLKEDITNGAVWDFDYDILGNLLRVETPAGDVIDYVVDALNRRVGKKINGILVQGFLYDGNLNPIAQLDATGSVIARFVYGLRAHVPDYMVTTSGTYQIVSDQIGSVVAVIDVVTGDIVQRLEYDAWGRVLTDTNPGFQPFGFAGGLYDADTGLVRFGTRDYDAEVGRWTAKDPEFADPEMRTYAYGELDSFNNYDPTGQDIVNGGVNARERRQIRRALRCIKRTFGRDVLKKLDEMYRDVTISISVYESESRRYTDDHVEIDLKPGQAYFSCSDLGWARASLCQLLAHEMGHLLTGVPTEEHDKLFPNWDNPVCDREKRPRRCPVTH